jgi:hypothetical protein
MSSATSLAKPFSKPITQCPYCDHVSPPGSKFCGECGAALHLLPCPHCGAVNDITIAKNCYRCHGDLPEHSASKPASVPIPEAPEPSTILPDKSATITATYTELAAEPSARQRPHVWVVGIVLVAFAAASYYAYRQRSALTPSEKPPVDAAQMEKKMPAPASTATLPIKISDPAAPPGATASPAEKINAKGIAPSAPATTAKPETPPISSPATPSDAGPPARTGGGRGVARGDAGNVTAIAPPSAEPAKRSNLAKPNIGPCTEAVAALGLCTNDPNARR